MRAESRAEAWRPWIGRVVAVMLAAMLLYLALTLWSGQDRLLSALSRFPSSTYLPLVFSLVLAGWGLRALRWHYYVRYLRWPVPMRESLLAFLASFALTATPGKAGEVVKAGLLRSRYGVAMTETTGVLLVERLGDVLAVLMLAAGGLTLWADARLYLVLCLIAAGALTFFLTNERLYRSLFRWLARWPRLAAGAEKGLALFETGHALLRPLPFGLGLGLALMAWCCEALAFGLILQGFGLAVPVATAFSIYGVATIVGALSMLPGGVGGVEAAMLLLLAAAGVNAAEAVAPIVLARFSSLWLISLLGFAFMGVWWLAVERGSRSDAHP